MQLSVLPGLPACCFDLFTSSSRSALLDTTDMPLIHIQSETPNSIFGLCITKKFETKKGPEIREDPPPKVSYFAQDLV